MKEEAKQEFLSGVKTGMWPIGVLQLAALITFITSLFMWVWDSPHYKGTMLTGIIAFFVCLFIWKLILKSAGNTFEEEWRKNPLTKNIK